MGGILARIFKRVLEKTMENSELLDRQARLGIEPGTSRKASFERRTAPPLVERMHV